MFAHYLAVSLMVVYLAYLLKSHLELIQSVEYHTFQCVNMTDFPRDASNPEQIQWVQKYALEVLGIAYPYSRCLKVMAKYDERFPMKS